MTSLWPPVAGALLLTSLYLTGHLVTSMRRLRSKYAELKHASTRIRELETVVTKLEVERAFHLEAHESREQAELRMNQAFQALCSDALSRNNQLFLNLAETSLQRFHESAKSDLGKRQEAIDRLLHPVKESLVKFEGKLTDLERSRLESAVELKSQMQQLTLLQGDLQKETFRLASALKTTTIRGRWGEIQLRRVVELAGMVAHCDFAEQQTLSGDDGRKRPDMIVRLPTGKVIVVDAKAPLDAYLEATTSDDEEIRKGHMKRHAEHIRQHIRALSAKGYAEQVASFCEFVVLYLPGETFFSAALAEDPLLIETGAEHGVILATPTTLISLLRAVSFGWKQEAISQNAERISSLGAELYKRLSIVTGHWSRVGKQLGSAIEAYNEAVGSLERRVLVTAREFERLGVQTGQNSLLSPNPIDSMPRALDQNG